MHQRSSYSATHAKTSATKVATGKVTSSPDVRWPPLPVAMHETADELLIDVEIRDPNQLQISVSKDMLLMEGKLENVYKHTDEDIVSRFLHLPCEINPTGLQTEYHQGILHIRVPKERQFR